MSDTAKRIFAGLVVTILGGLMLSMISSLLGIANPSPTPVPIVIPYNSGPDVIIVTATPANETPSSSQQRDSGSGYATYESDDSWVNQYQGYQVDLASLPVANSNQVYVLHGDILVPPQNQCNIAVIRAGQSPSQFSVSGSSWQLVRLTGSEAQIANSLELIENNAARDSSTGTCPRIN